MDDRIGNWQVRCCHYSVSNWQSATLFGFNFEPEVAIVASQSNVGGSTSSLAIARSLGREDLVLPGILTGLFGNALGTFVGFWVVTIL